MRQSDAMLADQDKEPQKSEGSLASPARAKDGRWVKNSKSPNPKGRPKGARQVFSERFIHDLNAAWKKHGVKAIDKVATEEPAKFLQIVVKLVPKQVQLNGDGTMQELADGMQAVKAFLQDAAKQRSTKQEQDAQVIDVTPDTDHSST